MRAKAFLLRGILVVGLLLFSVSWQAFAAPLAATAQVEQPVVQIIAADEGRGGRLIPKWSGTGVLISADGLILTNCHVAMPRLVWDEPAFDYDLLIVALTSRQGKPAVPTYLAEVAQYDAGLDLAVLQIIQTLDGSPVDETDLELPALSLGDSDALAAGDTLDLYGYAGPADEPVDSVSSTIEGFSSGRGIKGRAWIRTDAQVEGGFSGGPAVSQDGEVMGIVAAGAAAGADEVLQCRYEEDTNGDGVMDLSDTCAATGGTTGTVRPANLVLPLIKAADSAVRPETTPEPRPKPTREPAAVEASIGRLIFAPDVDGYDQPVTVVESLPSDAETLYLFFDYKNFEEGATWQPVLTYDGEVQDNLWPAAQWDGGAQGNTWIGLGGSDEALDDGIYEFGITYEGTLLGSATIEVGGQAEKQPTFSNLVFSAGGEEGYFLPGGVTEIEAAFEYANMTRNTKWSYVGYIDGEEIGRGDGDLFTRASGLDSLTLSSETALPAGVHRLELYIGDRLAATADCVVGEKGTEELFGPITFAEGIDRKGNPVRPGTAFKTGLSELYAFFDYQGMQDGWEWGWQWTINGEALKAQKKTWDGGESGQNELIRVYSDETLPDGEYQLDLMVKGEVVQSGTATIGGKAPKPTPTPKKPIKAEGVEIRGRITDAETGRGIPGAYFGALKPGITGAEFDEEDDIYTLAETDRQGNFTLPDPLMRGESYTLIVVAEGYQRISEDDVYVNEDAESPLELSIALQKER